MKQETKELLDTKLNTLKIELDQKIHDLKESAFFTIRHDHDSKGSNEYLIIELQKVLDSLKI